MRIIHQSILYFVLMNCRYDCEMLEAYLKRGLWGYHEVYEEFNLSVRPVLTLLREENMAKWRRHWAASPELNVDTPRSQSKSENRNEHGSVSGSPHGSVVNISVPDAGSVAVKTGQPGTEPESRRQPDDEASPSDEHSPSAAITGGPEVVDSTPSGPSREPEIAETEDDAVTRHDRLAEEEMNKTSPAAVEDEGRSSE